MNCDPDTVLARARACLEIERDALEATAASLDASFVAVVQALLDAIRGENKLLFTGVGKSAHIAQKLAGTFNSIGVPSLHFDPTQALHGDLGLVAARDVCLMFSNSGQSDELLRLLPLLRRFGVTTIAITSHPDSGLAKGADLSLCYRVPREACPLRLAPTASTTAALAMGDALAMVVMELRGFTREDFARFHPGGSLGMVLLLHVSDIMRSGERLPVQPDRVTLQEAVMAMTRAKAGSIALTDATGRLSGILTDGDFRRSALSGPDFLSKPASAFMTRTPITVKADALAVDALKLFERHNIDDIIVVDEEGRPAGIVDGQDLPRLKIV